MVIETMRHKSREIFGKIETKVKKMKINKKYIIILVVGIIFMLVSRSPKKIENAKPVQSEQYVLDASELETVLETVRGAGDVRVFISYKNNGTKEIAQQIERGENEIRNTPEEIGDTYYVLSERYPEIAGVLITATGADSVVVQTRLLSAAKHALGVPYHKITVQIGTKGGK